MYNPSANFEIDTTLLVNDKSYFEEVTSKLKSGYYKEKKWTLEEDKAYAKADQKFRKRNFEDFIDAKPKHPMPVSKPRRSEAELIFSRLLRNLGF